MGLTMIQTPPQLSWTSGLPHFEKVALENSKLNRLDFNTLSLIVHCDSLSVFSILNQVTPLAMKSVVVLRYIL